MVPHPCLYRNILVLLEVKSHTGRLIHAPYRLNQVSDVPDLLYSVHFREIILHVGVLVEIFFLLTVVVLSIKRVVLPLRVKDE